jgi:hypothetical protein
MGELLVLDHAAYLEALNRQPMAVCHRLADHPLLDLEALAELADRLTPDDIEQNAAVQPLVVAGGGNKRGGVLRPEELVRRVAEERRWIVLWNVERDRAYGDLLDEILDPVHRLIGRREGGERHREAFVFISAADSVTPVHIDPEHNFLLQIRGTKDLHVAPFADAHHAQSELERRYTGGHRNLEAEPGPDRCFSMDPGTGTYLPSEMPHWVLNGPDVSISLSVTFHTQAIIRSKILHGGNARLRRLGFHPSLPGRRPRMDRLKYAAYLAFNRLDALRAH